MATGSSECSVEGTRPRSVTSASPGTAHRLTSRIGPTAGTHADQDHVQTADDALDEAQRVFKQSHHTFNQKMPMGKMAECLLSSRFESFLSLVICLNMCLIIAETDLTADGQAPPIWITTANITFLVVYFLECLLKIAVFRLAYFQDTWNWLDLLVVFSDVLLTLLNFFNGVERISVMRVFRLIKLARAIRVVRQIWELRILLLGFKAAAKSIFFGMGMVIVMTIVWAILGVQLIHPVNAEIWADSDCESCQEAFRSVWNSCLTIFQTVVAGDSWGLLAIPIIHSAWWTSVWFLVVLVTVQLAMLNLILAVIVERAADARDQEVKKAIMNKEESMQKSKLKLIEMCRQLDTDGSGLITEDEFLNGFENNPDFAAAVLGMGVYPEDVGLLFEVVDTKGTGEVTYVTFVNTLARLRTQMNQVILFSITELRKSFSEMQTDLSQLKGGMNQLKTDRWKSQIPSVESKTGQGSFLEPEEAVENAAQMEEMSRDMQRKLQEMQRDLSQSFKFAARILQEVAQEPHHLANGELQSLKMAEAFDLDEFNGVSQAGASGQHLQPSRVRPAAPPGSPAPVVRMAYGAACEAETEAVIQNGSEQCSREGLIDC